MEKYSSVNTLPSFEGCLPRGLLMHSDSNDKDSNGDATAAEQEKESFQMHRKLLRRRHVRKLEKAQERERQRQLWEQVEKERKQKEEEEEETRKKLIEIEERWQRALKRPYHYAEDYTFEPMCGVVPKRRCISHYDPSCRSFSAGDVSKITMLPPLLLFTMEDCSNTNNSSCYTYHQSESSNGLVNPNDFILLNSGPLFNNRMIAHTPVRPSKIRKL